MRSVLMARPVHDAMQELMYANCAARQLEKLGRASEAERLYAQAEDQAARTIGRQSEWYLIPALRHAEMLHMRGERVRADAMFEAAISGSTGGAPAQLYYGAALAREGRAADSLPLLEAALAEARLHARDEDTVRYLQGVLGDAYDQVGRAEEARALLRSARTAWMIYGPPHGARNLGARERWAQFLLDHGEDSAADAELRAVLAQVDQPSAPAFLAAAGLAHLALAHGDLKTADSMSMQAVEILQSMTLQYDARIRLDVWCIRAEVLHAEGASTEARAWAQKAVTEAEQYDAPSSPKLARAHILLQKLI
jgi:tetratricopeptide (TPR) repeat protein